MRAIRQFGTFNRPVQLLLINQFAIMMGFSMLMPYLTGYLTTTLGFAAWVAGLVLGLRTFSQQGMSVISAAGIIALDCKEMKTHTSGASRFANMTEARS
jgi:hypothetical protein